MKTVIVHTDATSQLNYHCKQSDGKHSFTVGDSFPVTVYITGTAHELDGMAEELHIAATVARARDAAERQEVLNVVVPSLTVEGWDQPDDDRCTLCGSPVDDHAYCTGDRNPLCRNRASF